MSRALLVVLCLSSTACEIDLSAVGAAGSVAGCAVGNALADSLAPPDFTGEGGALEARMSCPLRFPFAACGAGGALAVGTIEDLTLEVPGGVSFSVETSDESIMAINGFETMDEGCGPVARGQLLPGSAGDVFVVVRGEQGEPIDRIPFRVQQPVRLIPAFGSDPIRIQVGQDPVIGAVPENKIGETLHASGGFTWSVDVDGIVEIPDGDNAFKQIVGVAPGTVRVTLDFGELQTTIEVTVAP